MILAASITRTSLALADLNINDRVKYIVSDGFDSGAVSWRREQVESPYVESKITVGRVRDVVEAKMAIQVLGSTQAVVADNITELVEAFTQDQFTLTVTMDGTQYRWLGEAADYTMDWSRERIHSRVPLVAFGFLRHPIPVAGPI